MPIASVHRPRGRLCVDAQGDNRQIEQDYIHRHSQEIDEIVVQTIKERRWPNDQPKARTLPSVAVTTTPTNNKGAIGFRELNQGAVNIGIGVSSEPILMTMEWVAYVSSFTVAATIRDCNDELAKCWARVPLCVT